MLGFGPAARPVDLIFLHANGFNALTYRRILAPLGDRFHVLAADQRGHGASTLPAHAEGRVDWNDFRDDLVALMETLDVKGAVLAGHSMGGATCLMAAAVAPCRARRLVLFDPVILPREAVGDDRPQHGSLVEGAMRRRAEFPSRAAAFKTYRHRAAFRTWPDDMLADYVEAGFAELAGGGVRLACDPAWEASTFAAQASDPWSAFARVTCPIEILKSETGSACHADQHDLAADRVSVETLGGTSHFLPMERPEAASARLMAALDGG